MRVKTQKKRQTRKIKTVRQKTPNPHSLDSGLFFNLGDTFMFKNIRKTVAFAIPILLLLTSGCATIEGAGKDIESAGEAIQDAAEQ
jgi:predicted small secreted protein